MASRNARPAASCIIGALKRRPPMPTMRLARVYAPLLLVVGSVSCSDPAPEFPRSSGGTCADDASCPEGEFCEFAIEAACGAGDATGRCELVTAGTENFGCDL